MWLNRMDGHMYLANSLAMRLAGVDKNTPNTPGGTIVRLGDGEPSGIFKDNATNWYVVGHVVVIHQNLPLLTFITLDNNQKLSIVRPGSLLEFCV